MVLACAKITLHTILLGVGGTICNAHTLVKFKKLGIDPQRSTNLKLARKLLAHPVQYAQKLTSTRLAIEIKNTHHKFGTACFQKPTRPTLASLVPSGEGDMSDIIPIYMRLCKVARLSMQPKLNERGTESVDVLEPFVAKLFKLLHGKARIPAVLVGSMQS
eukprot:1156493-Pelagomonas_calceolata.AAC.2